MIGLTEGVRVGFLGGVTVGILDGLLVTEDEEQTLRGR
jgi:hypothetical protein